VLPGGRQQSHGTQQQQLLFVTTNLVVFYYFLKYTTIDTLFFFSLKGVREEENACSPLPIGRKRKTSKIKTTDENTEARTSFEPVSPSPC